MEVGLFQLENLLAVRTQFVLLDLRLEARPWPASLQKILQGAIHVTLPKEYLLQNKAALAMPVILIDENGHRANEAARTLEESGYTNVYTVAGGVEGLLSDV